MEGDSDGGLQADGEEGVLGDVVMMVGFVGSVGGVRVSFLESLGVRMLVGCEGLFACAIRCGGAGEGVGEVVRDGCGGRVWFFVDVLQQGGVLCQGRYGGCRCRFSH